MSLAKMQSAIPAIELLQAYACDRVAFGIGF
jgi:hypothetical protein